jgi:phosphopantothenoylcysteine decarboxylase/phosphopantothenate--cysteine ligase
VRLLVTAGGTREPLDPVRYIGNRSSGRQGIALAQAAAERGAMVTLIAANIEVDLPRAVAGRAGSGSIAIQPVSTTLELSDATHAAAASADAIIMAAAVADYRPETVADSKIKKETTGDALTLTLLKNPDILHDLAARWPGTDGPVIIGFAAETETDRERLLELGRAKIARKGCDFLVLNSVGWTAGFATPDNTIILLDRAGDIVGEASGTKLSVAARILDLLPQTQHPSA